MKDVISDVLQFLLGAIFNIWTFFLCLFGFVIIASNDYEAKQNQLKEANRVATEICYNKGMVLVQTDAGNRCADPATLVKVN